MNIAKKDPISAIGTVPADGLVQFLKAFENIVCNTITIFTGVT